ncbi:MAG TPA: carbohydrate ABC transporter permease [Nocardioides sp.]|jgi:ABC-type glycerol-3-phosphate transport system permease component|uniref:carbohydrate ABC transporter permease n=1 Tax=Nocardioides sp. TaxID=35761 RepID=UPI002E316A36|nr:carbohydrate ABC transporter permease [Nocardioides sp.]HEX3929625.1 carbohydrate ABC transporter permease [Nocardioides sp.]
MSADLVTGAINRGLAARIAARVGGGALRIFLIVVALLWLLPTFGLLVESFRDPAQYANGNWWQAIVHPAQLTAGNYSALLHNSTMVSSFFNTIKITVPATILVVLIGSAAGYAFAWMEFPGRDALFLLVVGLLVIPIQIALIPVVKLYSFIGISGTILSVICFHVGFGLPFAVFLLRNYFAGIPRDLMEAARMDGASEARIFFRVILPLGMPAIASLGIFQFLWVWNDLLVALVFSNANSQPITVALASQTRQFGSSIDILAPGAFLSLIVPLVVFLSFQRYFVQGVMAGSVK